MDKSSFRADTRCTVTLRDEGGRARPANLYVFRAYESFLVARALDQDGLLRKIPYERIERVVEVREADEQTRYRVPAALLDEKTWQGRSDMALYATSPRLGK